MSDWAPKRFRLGLFQKRFHYMRLAPKCTEIWFVQNSDLSHLRPICPTSEPNLTSLRQTCLQASQNTCLPCPKAPKFIAYLAQKSPKILAYLAPKSLLTLPPNPCLHCPQILAYFAPKFLLNKHAPKIHAYISPSTQSPCLPCPKSLLTLPQNPFLPWPKVAKTSRLTLLQTGSKIHANTAQKYPKILAYLANLCVLRHLGYAALCAQCVHHHCRHRVDRVLHLHLSHTHMGSKVERQKNSKIWINHLKLGISDLDSNLVRSHLVPIWPSWIPNLTHLLRY